MAPEGCAGILPIPRSSREHDAVAYLQTSRVQAMAECSGPPQPARTDALGTLYPSLEPVDSSTPHSAPLSRCTLLRRSSLSLIHISEPTRRTPISYAVFCL